VKHFGTDSLHIATKPNKDALLMALGYVVKAGHHKQLGTFSHRGVDLDPNPEVYRFNYLVKDVDDAHVYFEKVIKENLGSDRTIIDKYAKREDAIGRWLRKNPGHTASLRKLAYIWHLDYINDHKKGFRAKEEFTQDPTLLREAYRTYLEEFPAIFGEYKPKTKNNEPVVLEQDYNKHEKHDLDVLEEIIFQLNIAIEYGSNRPLKSLNLYLWSKAPSFGKTRLLNFLNNNLMAYRLPDNQWYVDYENGLYQVLVSDEAQAFLKSKSYSHLKHVFEGQKVEFNLKGKTKIMKEDNPLIALAENKSFHDLMAKHFEFNYQPEVMATRVLDLEVKSRATLHFLLDRCFEIKR
jgi:hypothetical protein